MPSLFLAFLIAKYFHVILGLEMSNFWCLIVEWLPFTLFLLIELFLLSIFKGKFQGFYFSFLWFFDVFRIIR